MKYRNRSSLSQTMNKCALSQGAHPGVVGGARPVPGRSTSVGQRILRRRRAVCACRAAAAGDRPRSGDGMTPATSGCVLAQEFGHADDLVATANLGSARVSLRALLGPPPERAGDRPGQPAGSWPAARTRRSRGTSTSARAPWRPTAPGSWSGSERTVCRNWCRSPSDCFRLGTVCRSSPWASTWCSPHSRRPP